VEVYLQVDSLRREALLDLRGADLSRCASRRWRRWSGGRLHHPGATVKQGVNDATSRVWCASRWTGAACAASPSSRCRTPGATTASSRRAPDGADADPPQGRRGRRLRAGDLIPCPAIPTDLHRLRPARRPRSDSGDLAAAREVLVSAAPTRWRSSLSGAAARVFDLFSLSTPRATPREARQPALLPAAGGGAADARLRAHLPGGDLAVPRPVQLRPGTVKRSCVHFVQPDGQIIPFDTSTPSTAGAAGNAALARRGRRGDGRGPPGQAPRVVLRLPADRHGALMALLCGLHGHLLDHRVVGRRPVERGAMLVLSGVLAGAALGAWADHRRLGHPAPAPPDPRGSTRPSASRRAAGRWSAPLTADRPFNTLYRPGAAGSALALGQLRP